MLGDGLKTIMIMVSLMSVVSMVWLCHGHQQHSWCHEPISYCSFGANQEFDYWMKIRHSGQLYYATNTMDTLVFCYDPAESAAQTPCINILGVNVCDLLLLFLCHRRLGHTVSITSSSSYTTISFRQAKIV